MGPEAFAPAPGWFDDGGHFATADEYPFFGSVAPRLVGDEHDGRPILLYKAFRDVLGGYPKYFAQDVGECVGDGHGHGVDLLQCVEIALGEPSEYRETDTVFVYATSREVAGILGRGDGSYGSAAVKAMQTIGVASVEMVGAPGPDGGARATAWGRYGVPADVKRAAGAYRLGGAARVTTWAELVAAMRNGYPVTICSNQGFEDSWRRVNPRDAWGFCTPGGTWGHCMLIGGVRFDRPGACILQSWGPDVPSGPLALDQPSYSFWADRYVVEAMLAQGDSWALRQAPAFVERRLPAHWSYASAA